MEVGFNREEEGFMRAKVKRRAVDFEGKPIGVANDNPLLDSREYLVEFLNGQEAIYRANIIAENLLAQVDEEGKRHLLMAEIVDHKTDSAAVPKDKGTYKTQSGTVRLRRTTAGYSFLVMWKDKSSTWVKLKDLKDSYPVQVADYAVAKQLEEEPAFKWWVPHVLKKRKAIIKKVKSKYWERNTKYGLRIPKTIAEALAIDKENGNTLWEDSVKLEMKNSRVAFETYDGDPSDLAKQGYQQITAHMIFDIKLSENFRRKARLVADGHKLPTPSSVTYSSVVSRDSIRILLLIAALNDLEIFSADVQSAFLSANNLEKHWLRAGPEFGEEQGKIFLVVRSLYGLKSASASFRAMMASRLDEAGFKSSVADHDVWMRPSVKHNGEKCYTYISNYVDDQLCIGPNAKKVLNSLQGGTVKFKNGKIEEPEVYLGARLQKKKLNGKEMWTVSSKDYVKAAIDTTRTSIKGKRWKIPTSPKTPMSTTFVPELDQTSELEREDITLFQEIIGMMRWAVELGRVDILHELSILSQYQASPREGHLQELLRVVGYLAKKPKLTLYMNPDEPDLDYSLFEGSVEGFKEYYRDAKEILPRDMPEPRGKAVVTLAFVDSSHAANRITRRSHSGHILFVNRAPVKWFSKRQQTVETSAFSSEFIALKHCIEDIEFLRFKLRMFGVPLRSDLSETLILCDNEAVVKNSSKVESTLNKKHSAVAYHFCRFSVAARICKVAWISTGSNLADAMTKRLPEVTGDELFGDWTY